MRVRTLDHPVRRRELEQEVLRVTFRVRVRFQEGLADRLFVLGPTDQVFEREPDAGKQPLRFGKRFGGATEEMGHLIRRFQMALGIRLQHPARFGNGRAEPDATEDIVQRPLPRLGVERVVRGEQRNAGFRGALPKSGKTAAIIATAVQVHTQPDAIRRSGSKPAQGTT